MQVMLADELVRRITCNKARSLARVKCMSIAVARRFLLVCLVLLMSMQCMQWRSLGGQMPLGVAEHVAQSQHVAQIRESDASMEHPVGDSLYGDIASLSSGHDLPDDTHGAMRWLWSSYWQPHAMTGFSPGLDNDVQINKLLRPPRV